MEDILLRHKEIWNSKKLLREIYFDMYERIILNLSTVKGKTLELGSGTGNFKDFKPDIISSDIDPKPWLDMSFDAHNIPFKKNELANITMIDVFHHLSNPIVFLNEAYRVLKPGGRIIMIEPYPSFFSLIVYRLFHPEPFNFNIDYFSPTYKPTKKNAWDSNQAIPYLFFFKSLEKFNKIYLNKLQVNKIDIFSFLLYPLSGGFENQQLIPNSLITFFKHIDKALRIFKGIFAFRCIIVIEKKHER